MVNSWNSFFKAIVLTLLVLCGLRGWGQSGPHTCANAVQFCSASGLEVQYKYHMSFESGPDYGCLQPYMNTYNNQSTARNVVWFYLNIKDPGSITLSIGNNGLFPDFCCWGPFTTKPTKNQLTSSKIIDCNAANAQIKTSVINNTQAEEYYIYAVTYYYNTNKKLIVEKIGGSATTYCPLEPVLSSNASVLCEGESLVLSETAISDANQYNWTGPDGATYSGQVWNRSPATPSMSGKYNCVVIRGSEYGESNIDVLVTTQPNITLTADDTEICEGEEVAIHANVIYNSPAPGDILCTDGSIVKPSEWPKPGKTAKGVVFYVDASGQHGWAIGLHENQIKYWCNNQDMGNIPGLIKYNNARDAIKDFNGSVNTQLVSNPTTFPAAGYCIEQGGYLPSIGQLNIFFGELIVINNSLVKLGLAPIPDGVSWMYWSSTANSQTKVYRIDRTGQVLSVNLKQNNTSYRVRAVFDF